jgi:DNA recombination protein RmuC
LRTVAYTWRQEALADSTRRVLELGRELHGRLAVMGGHVTTLGKELTSAVKAYNATVGALESRVLVTARKLTEMKVVDATLEAPGPIEVATREIAAPELVGHVAGTILELPDTEELADPRYGLDTSRGRTESAAG